MNPTRLLAALPVLAAGLLALGCTSKVVGGGDGGGGSGQGGGNDQSTTSTGDQGGGNGTAGGGQGGSGGDETTTSTAVGTPLVLSFDSAPVEFVADAAHEFDLGFMSSSQVTDWPTAATPWLAMDRDGDGRISSGAELFGSMSPLANGSTAPNGFVALRELDTNHDGVIDARDPGFIKLLIWRDADGDRVSAPGELEPASNTLISIDLSYGIDRRCDARQNCEIERATFRYRDALGAERTGAIVDVHLRAQR